MRQHARGTFQVGTVPQAPQDDDTGASRSTIDKRFQGDLTGTSRGQMLAFATAEPGSAGYVAMEWVRGTLHGRSGGFALQHSGTMTRGSLGLSVTVVPDSGTDELVGLSGTMTIDIQNGQHHYGFEYTLDGSD